MSNINRASFGYFHVQDGKEALPPHSERKYLETQDLALIELSITLPV